MLQWTIVVFGILVLSFSIPTGSTQVHRVNVGNNGFRFDPNTTFANPGDIVTFVFYPNNHSVNRGPESTEAFGNPCVPYELVHPERTGFHSGNIESQSVDPDEVVWPQALEWK